MEYPIVVIGAGSGGLVVAIGAAKTGKRVLLIEKGNWGGDCTNFGCIPSKTLIAAAAYKGNNPMQHVRDVVATVRKHEEPDALKAKGVDTLEGVATFIDSHTLKVGEQIVKGERIVIAAGSSPLVPPVKGLKETPFLTNETIFSLDAVPKRLGVIGGGPIGCELAQAFARLGAEVSIIHRSPFLLKKEEPEAQAVIAKQLRKEGITLHLDTELGSVEHREGRFFLQNPTLECDQLLVSIGRKPNVEELNLKAAKIHGNEKGIPVDRYGRTNQKHIFALGDVVGGPQFTHVAENQARTILLSLLLPINLGLNKQSIPRVTYTDPEVASFGALESEAVEKHGKEEVFVSNVPMSETDRAITAGRTEGFVKVVTKKKSSEILGATIVAPRAGEMLTELSLAKKEKIPLKKLSQLIHPYPTYNGAIRRAADIWMTEVFVPKLKHPLKHLSIRKYLPIIIIVALMIAGYFSGVYEYFTFENLKSQHQVLKGFVSSHPILTPLLFTLLYIIATALSFPGGAILSLIGGYLFDVPLATIYVVCGATIGASLIFLAARSALADLLKRKAGPFLKKMENGFKKNAWSYLLFLRFIPVFPFWLVNIAPSFFNVRLLTFVWTTFVGIIPGSYVFTQAGAGLSAVFETGEEFSIANVLNVELRIALVAIALLSLIPIFVKKIIKSRKKNIENR